MTRLVGTMVLLAFAGATWAAGPPDAATWTRFGQIEEAVRLNRRSVGLYQAEKTSEATAAFARVLEMREGLYPRARYPLGHPDLARSLNNMASVFLARGEYAKAEPLFRRALEMREELYSHTRFPQGHLELAQSVNDLAMLHQTQGGYEKAEPLSRRALEIYQRLYPKSRFPEGHPDLAISSGNLAGLYQLQGEYTKAEPLFRYALEMSQELYPKQRFPRGHPDLALDLNNLALLHQTQGDYAKAEPLYRRALAMYEALYPKERFPQGHIGLARSVNNLAFLYYSQAEYAKAEPLYRRGLAMYEALCPKERFPRGHPELAGSLKNLASLHSAQKEYAKAEPLYARALEMRERLFPRAGFPQGHPALVISLNSLAFLHKSQGDYTKAEPLFARALEMSERLYPQSHYPQGHPYLAMSLSNLASLQYSQGEYAKAELMYRRALKIFSDSATSLAASSSDATAMNYVGLQPAARDAYLSTTNHLPKVDVYLAVWQTKAALARVAERRHLAVLAASSKEARELWDAILSLKRQRERLLLALADAARAKARDARLDEIDEEIRKKEAALRPLLPTLKRSDDLARASPADLQKALPADVVFIDWLRYNRIEQDPKQPGKKGETNKPSYVAFVVTRNAITRVELGAAKPIEEALDLWRRSIDENSDGHAKHANMVHPLVWAPIAKHLPAGTKTVYLCPDMDLSRLPWAALPGKLPGTILLEDHLLVTVPHGPYLLDRLSAKREKAPATPIVLTMGGVAYDKSPAASTEVASLRSPMEGKGLWPALAGTKTEVAMIHERLGDRKRIVLDADKAGVASLLAELPRADHAHLATHGYFADAKFRSVLQLDPKLFQRGLGDERAGAGTRSPMVLSGLVCAGANVKDTPNRGIVTADAIVGLDLRRLNLAVLSACETGLGDVAGGEGVFGLQRAFHVAGTRVVIASLWKVDDEATAALMALFYRHLWDAEKPLPPAEAMRQAQLAVFRSPQHVGDWAKGRGPNLKVVVAGTPAKPPVKGAKLASPKVYAAFVVSGVAR